MSSDCGRGGSNTSFAVPQPVRPPAVSTLQAAVVTPCDPHRFPTAYNDICRLFNFGVCPSLQHTHTHTSTSTDGTNTNSGNRKVCRFSHRCMLCLSHTHGYLKCRRRVCVFFNRESGCLNSAKKCSYTHTCTLCLSPVHSLPSCPKLKHKTEHGRLCLSWNGDLKCSCTHHYADLALERRTHRCLMCLEAHTLLDHPGFMKRRQEVIQSWPRSSFCQQFNSGQRVCQGDKFNAMQCELAHMCILCKTSHAALRCPLRMPEACVAWNLSKDASNPCSRVHADCGAVCSEGSTHMCMLCGAADHGVLLHDSAMEKAEKLSSSSSGSSSVLSSPSLSPSLPVVSLAPELEAVPLQEQALLFAPIKHICFRWNVKRSCSCSSDGKCPWLHVCLICRRPHRIGKCPRVTHTAKKYSTCLNWNFMHNATCSASEPGGQCGVYRKLKPVHRCRVCGSTDHKALQHIMIMFPDDHPSPSPTPISPPTQALPHTQSLTHSYNNNDSSSNSDNDSDSTSGDEPVATDSDAQQRHDSHFSLFASPDPLSGLASLYSTPSPLPLPLPRPPPLQLWEGQTLFDQDDQPLDCPLMVPLSPVGCPLAHDEQPNFYQYWTTPRLLMV